VTFSTEAWQSIRTVRGAIDRLPFLRALADGSLPTEVFNYYLTQDAHYLASYGRVLAGAAAQTDQPDELVFWAQSAVNTVTVERQLHAAHVFDFSVVEPSPTCTAYTSYLFSLTSGGSYPALIAGILPCFWIYEDVGRRLKERVGDLAAHPYADWVGTYGDPDFARATERARAIVDQVAQKASAADRERMRAAFATASRYEWMFWDTAWRRETWPV